MTEINFDVFAASDLATEPWRARLGAFCPRPAFLGTGVPGGGGVQPSVVARSVPRVQDSAVQDRVVLAIPVPQPAPTATLGQPNNYNHMTSVLAFGEGASGPPPYREPA